LTMPTLQLHRPSTNSPRMGLEFASMLVLVPPRCSIQQRRSKWPIWDYDATAAGDLWTTLGTAPLPYWSASFEFKGWIIIVVEK
jgi:hypothetical protein